MTPADLRLVIICPDRTGIIARVSGFISNLGGSVGESSQYSDPVSGMFFMRYVIAGDSLPFGAAGFREAFRPTAEEYRMTWHVTDTARPNRVVLLVSKLEHCLTDLLYRWKSGDLAFDIPCVISNHDDGSVSRLASMVRSAALMVLFMVVLLGCQYPRRRA